ncbi:hypothetical protein FRB94_013156 [Tulasnella sp. JGI-2019a]|nr:hypothetical protein FRB93_010889 [Tulasnella sp. JGI-2019a]KAG8990716.1 hypothetical protein FRB94_013156 [Tulasnella sp. JGI-2019a]
MSHVNGQFEAQPRPDLMAFPVPYYPPPSAHANPGNYPNPEPNVNGIPTQNPSHWVHREDGVLGLLTGVNGVPVQSPPLWLRPTPAPTSALPAISWNTQVDRENGVMGLLTEMRARQGQMHEVDGPSTVRTDLHLPAAPAPREKKNLLSKGELVRLHYEKYKAEHRDEQLKAYLDHIKMLYTQGDGSSSLCPEYRLA